MRFDDEARRGGHEHSGANAVVNDGISVDVTKDEAKILVTVSGEIDLGSIGRLEDELDTVDASADVVLDCSRVDFIDSSGLRLLAQESRRIADAGGSLRLRNPSSSVRRVVEIAGFDELI